MFDPSLEETYVRRYAINQHELGPRKMSSIEIASYQKSNPLMIRLSQRANTHLVFPSWNQPA